MCIRLIIVESMDHLVAKLRHMRTMNIEHRQQGHCSSTIGWKLLKGVFLLFFTSKMKQSSWNNAKFENLVTYVKSLIIKILLQKWFELIVNSEVIFQFKIWSMKVVARIGQKRKSILNINSIAHSILIMALPVVEFSGEGYQIRKVFA